MSRFFFITWLFYVFHVSSRTATMMGPVQRRMLSIFVGKSRRAHNDMANKQREKWILSLFEEEPTEPVAKDIRRQLAVILDRDNNGFTLEHKGGRHHNYDFLVHCLAGGDSRKMEFKYGRRCPQLLSVYVTNRRRLFVNPERNYVPFWYSGFLSSYLSIVGILPGDVPAYRDYVRTINSTSYSLPLQQRLRCIMKGCSAMRQDMSAVVDGSIQDYLYTLRLRDIGFDSIQHALREQQQKLFVSCHDGKLSSYSLPQDISIDRRRYDIEHGNTLVLYTCGGGACTMRLLLRWKNHKGVAGPAWQLSLR